MQSLRRLPRLFSALPLHAARLSSAAHPAMQQLERERAAYASLGGCTFCLDRQSYECLRPDLCRVEKAEDRDLLTAFRTVLLDTQDLLSDRPKDELRRFPGPATNLGSIKMDDWASYLVSRGFTDAENPRTQRHLSKALSFSLTIAQFLMQRTNLNFTDTGVDTFTDLRRRIARGMPLCICILGPRAEATLPPPFHLELSHLLPGTRFDLLFVGPEVPAGLDRQTHNLSSTMAVRGYAGMYHKVHDDLILHDKMPDLYVAFNAGLGSGAHVDGWKPTLEFLFETKRPVILTSHDAADCARDTEALCKQQNRFAWLLHPETNRFRSLRFDINPIDPRHMISTNWAVTAIQGV